MMTIRMMSCLLWIMVLHSLSSAAHAASFENTWFAGLAQNQYTIQLVGRNGDKEFVKKIARGAPKEETTAVLTLGEDYIVVHGVYESVADAEAAIESLPEKTKKYGTTVKSVGKIINSSGFDAPKSGSEVLSAITDGAAGVIDDYGKEKPAGAVSSFGPVPIAVNKPTSTRVADAAELPAKQPPQVIFEETTELVVAPASGKATGKDAGKGAADDSAAVNQMAPLDVPATDSGTKNQKEQLATNDAQGTKDVMPMQDSDGPVSEQKDIPGKKPPQTDKAVAANASIDSDDDSDASGIGPIPTQPIGKTKTVAAENKFNNKPKSAPALVPQPNVTRAVPLKEKKSEAPKDMMNENPFEELIIEPKRGVTELLVISRDHLNRIRTNFKEPIVITIDDVDLNITDSTVYVSTTQAAPIALFISDGGAEETTVALSLLPKSNVPPQQVYLDTRLSKFRPEPEPEAIQIEGNTKRARNYELKDPYTVLIMNLLKTVADGEIPSGYSLVETRDNEPEPLCNQPNVHYQFKSPGQQVVGDNFTVAIGVATNLSNKTMEVVEEYCVGRQTAAVAFWPDVLLSPNASTEVYVVIKNWVIEEQRRVRERPDLLGRN